MAREVISLASDPNPRQAIQRAAAALAEGAIVGFPTETVYGVAASAARDDSVERLRRIKQHKPGQTFTVHVGNRADCRQFVPSLTPVAERLVKKGWPGPLTLIFQVDNPAAAPIYPKLSEAGRESIYGEGTVGVRCPDHAVAADLLSLASSPIIASGANSPGSGAATTAQMVGEQLGDQVDLLLDGGPTRYQRNSTIVALNGDGYKLLRAGVFDERTIRRLASVNFLFICTGNTCRSPMAEGIFKKMLAEKFGCTVSELAARGIGVRSAGTMAFSGGPASREAVEVCRRRGIDLSGHSARLASVDLLHPADYIFTMGRNHLEVLRSVSPSDAARADVLDPDSDISDPMGGTLEDYEKVAQKITAALQKRLKEVSL